MLADMWFTTIIMTLGLLLSMVMVNADWIRFESHCYLFNPSSGYSYDAAKSVCEAEDAHLVYVNSLQEGDFLRGHMMEHYSMFSTLNLRIGLKYNYEKALWLWDDGTVPCTDQWYGSGADDVGNYPELCARYGAIWGYRWNDQSCALSWGYICEKSCFDTNGLALSGFAEQLHDVPSMISVIMAWHIVSLTDCITSCIQHPHCSHAAFHSDDGICKLLTSDCNGVDLYNGGERWILYLIL